jgi:starch synthase
VVHAHGWFGAPALAFAKRDSPAAGRVLSLHDPNAQEELPADVTLPSALSEVLGEQPNPSLLAAGVLASQRVVASSQTLAFELVADASEHPLASALRPEGRLVGITNGLDAARWNPLTDPLIPARFDPVGIEGKARCKDRLQADVGLPVDPNVPLVIAVLEPGSDPKLLAEGATLALRNELQLVVLGADAEGPFASLARDYPERLALVQGTTGTSGTEDGDEQRLHTAIAASDLAIVHDELRGACELHLCALRYGSLPIALRVGALTDAIVDCDAQLETGTGFVFEAAKPEALAAAVTRALAAYAIPERFDPLRRRVMRLDLSWERSARRYEYLYKALAKS